MSITGTPVSATLTPIERTVQAVIATPNGQGYTLALTRESYTVDQNNARVGLSTLSSYQLNFADIAAETVTVSGVTMSVAQIAAFMQAYFDQKAQALKGVSP